ncbi:hypothetical protein AB0F20_05480 [Streptomyces goshikiensis]|uniref:hypothetical protein n=1 Tax=Streptomyces goshikiensis TaxID=1942 RepID=UPI00340D6987
MSDIIAGDPAPTNPQAQSVDSWREELRLLLSTGDHSGRTIDRALNGYRAEVYREMAARLARQLSGCCHECDACLGVVTRMAKSVTAAPAVPYPDPIAYGPTGYQCGCGKDAHSNLVPCAPEAGESRG